MKEMSIANADYSHHYQQEEPLSPKEGTAETQPKLNCSY